MTVIAGGLALAAALVALALIIRRGVLVWFLASAIEDEEDF